MDADRRHKSLEFEMKTSLQSTANGFVFLCPPPRLTHCAWCTQPVIPQLSNSKLKSKSCIVDCKNASPALEEDKHIYSGRLSAAIQSSLKTVQSKDNYSSHSQELQNSEQSVETYWSTHSFCPHLWVWLTVANRIQVTYGPSSNYSKKQTVTWHWMIVKSRKSRGKISLQGSNEVFTTSINLITTLE